MIQIFNIYQASTACHLGLVTAGARRGCTTSCLASESRSRDGGGGCPSNGAERASVPESSLRERLVRERCGLLAVFETATSGWEDDELASAELVDLATAPVASSTPGGSTKTACSCELEAASAAAAAASVAAADSVDTADSVADADTIADAASVVGCRADPAWPFSRAAAASSSEAGPSVGPRTSARLQSGQLALSICTWIHSSIQERWKR